MVWHSSILHLCDCLQTKEQVAGASISFYLFQLYVLLSSGISRKSAALIVRYSQKKKWISIVFYCSENPSIAHNFGTTGSIKWGFQQNVPLQMSTNRKLKMSHVQVPTDFPRWHHYVAISRPFCAPHREKGPLFHDLHPTRNPGYGPA